MDESLRLILEQLKELQDEEDHRNADSILIDLARILATRLGLSQEVETIVEAYYEVPKWYA